MKQAALPHQNFLEILHSPWGSSTIQLKWLHQGKTYIQTFFCFLGIKLLEVYLPLLGMLVHPRDVFKMGNTKDWNARELNSQTHPLCLMILNIQLTSQNYYNSKTTRLSEKSFILRSTCGKSTRQLIYHEINFVHFLYKLFNKVIHLKNRCVTSIYTVRIECFSF